MATKLKVDDYVEAFSKFICDKFPNEVDDEDFEELCLTLVWDTKLVAELGNEIFKIKITEPKEQLPAFLLYYFKLMDYDLKLDCFTRLGDTVVLKPFKWEFTEPFSITKNNFYENTDDKYKLEIYNLPITEIYLPYNLETFDISHCPIKKLIVPGSVTYLEQSIKLCDSLTEVILEDGVSQLGQYSIMDCDLIKSITLPKSIQIMSLPIFGCNNLTEIKYLGTKSQWDRIYKILGFVNWGKVDKIICTDGIVDLKDS